MDAVASAPLFRLGLVADAQFADRCDWERPGEPGRTKRFRSAEPRLAEALDHFARESSSLAAVVNLGDLFDGANDDDLAAFRRREGGMAPQLAATNRADLARMADVLSAHDPGVPVYHCLGNHDLNLPRGEVLHALGSPAAFFSVLLSRGWRLVVLDTTELNPRFVETGTSGHDEAVAFVTSCREQLKPWSGGLGSTQVEWLKATLAEAESQGERVIVASHVPLAPAAAQHGDTSWNGEELAALLEHSPAVAVCLAGHYHVGGYERRGLTHFVTLEAMLEAPAGSTAYAFLDVWPHEALLRGVGSVSNRRLQLLPTGVFTGI